MTRLETLRRAGRARFSELGFPKTRQEAWRFTNLGAIERTLFLPASAASAAVAIDALPAVTPTSYRLVFVNGASLQKVAAFVSEKLSTIEGVLSTATHFMLRSYKEHGFLLGGKVEETERLKVAP